MKFTRRNREQEIAAAIEYGRKLVAEQKDQEALEFLEKTIRKFPESAEIRMLLAMVYRGLRPGCVAPQLIKAAELGLDDPVIQVRAGHMFLNEKNVGAARSCATRASQLVDDEFMLAADLEGLIGRIAARDGDYEIAEEKLRSAVRREPEYSNHALHLARFLCARERNDDALAVIDRALGKVRYKEYLERLRSQIANEN